MSNFTNFAYEDLDKVYAAFKAARPAHWSEREWADLWTVWQSSSQDKRKRDRQALLRATVLLRKKPVLAEEDDCPPPRVGVFMPAPLAISLGGQVYKSMGSKG